MTENRIDYVLSVTHLGNVSDEFATEREMAREIYLDAVENEGIRVKHIEASCQHSEVALNGGIDIESGKSGNHHTTEYWILTASQEALEIEAERVKMEIPLKGLTVEMDRNPCFPCFAQKFEDETHIDYVSMPYLRNCSDLFVGEGKEGELFTNAHRIYLTYSILKHINIREELTEVFKDKSNVFLLQIGKVHVCKCCHRGKPRIKNFIGLEAMLEAKVFDDGYAVHERTKARNCCRPCCLCKGTTCCGNSTIIPGNSKFLADPVLVLSKTWICWKYQPLKCIRNYFGEKIAMYFAWFGFLTYYFGILACVGLGFFVYGLIHAAQEYDYTSIIPSDSAPSKLDFLIYLYNFMNHLFNNKSTTIFAIIVTIWGTLVAEMWKRKENNLAYRWDVNNYELSENRRPEYIVNRSRKHRDKNTEKTNAEIETQEFSSAAATCRRTIVSFTFIFTSVAIVFAGLFSIQIFRMFEEHFQCTKEDHSVGQCIFLATVLPISTQALFIQITDLLYLKLARFLTKRENHEYYTALERSFAVKVFLFQFANNYATLFYIAFIRHGTIQLEANGELVKDNCKLVSNIECFSQLTITTAGLMTAKSLLKSVKDSVFPLLKHWARKYFQTNTCLKKFVSCFLCKCGICLNILTILEKLASLNEEVQSITSQSSHNNKKDNIKNHIIKERSKEDWREILMGEYVEKCILYGYMMIFGASFTLGPLVIFIVLLIDLRLDAHRLLFSYRRPIPFQDSGIGVWAEMISFINYVGIVTTGAILAFTADTLYSWEPSLSGKTISQLIFFIIFENVLFLIKFSMRFIIKDVPHVINRSHKWEYSSILHIISKHRITDDDELSLKLLQKENQWYGAFGISCARSNQDPQISPEAS